MILFFLFVGVVGYIRRLLALPGNTRVSQPLRMRAFLIAALLATAQCYGPPNQQHQAPAAGAPSAPSVGLTEFCGTNCIPKQPAPQPQPVVAPQAPAHQAYPVPQQPQPVPQQPQPVPQQPPNYSNNPFLNGAVDLNKPNTAASIQQQTYQPQQIQSQQPSYNQPQQPSYNQPQQPSQIVQQPQQPNYANNPFFSGQVSSTGPVPAANRGRPCTIGSLCVAKQKCYAGVLHQEDVLQAKSQNEPCEQSRNEVCCRVPDLVQQGAGPSPSLTVQRPATVGAARFPQTTNKPYTGPLNTTPHIGCAAALKCVSLEYCTAAGVVSDVPVAVSRDDDTRVPLSECVDPDSGNYGFCCRDPNYKDPWPETQEICNPGTSCEAMWRCPGERMALPKKGCRVNQDGSTGICCLPPKGSQQQQFSQPPAQQQQQFNQFQQQQQQQVSSNVIDNRPAYATSVISQQPQPVVAQNPPLKPFNPPPQQYKPVAKPFNPPPPPAQAFQPTPQPSIPQPSYPVDPPPQPFVPEPQPSYNNPGPEPVVIETRPTQTQFFQQQSPASNQFPIQQIKVPAQSQTYQTTQRPFNVASAPVPVPVSGCGVRSVAPGAPQDGESAPGEFPWQALVSSVDGTRLCAGAVVSETAVVVSATCVQKHKPQQLQVEVGSWSPYSTAEERQVLAVMVSVPHPRYDANTQANDLAVLVLQRSLRFGRFVGAVCLPHSSELTTEGLLQSPGGACIISSWPKPADGSSKLHRVAVQPVEPAKCEESLRSTYLGKYFQLHSSFMCAAPLNPSQSMCPVNLGGALVCPRADGRYLLVGASSWDVGCAQPQPAVMCALDVEWVNQVLATPAADLQQQQQRVDEFVVEPDVAQQKPGFSQGYGR
ncbi:DNA translocase FtsK-like [Cloeon dipterum]|uniref:DNA translocase FtsK-like n=1 Tax=Cloeon dipterum TaxID=197152 RepID=UPI00321FE6C5